MRSISGIAGGIGGPCGPCGNPGGGLLRSGRGKPGAAAEEGGGPWKSKPGPGGGAPVVIINKLFKFIKYKIKVQCTNMLVLNFLIKL